MKLLDMGDLEELAADAASGEHASVLSQPEPLVVRHVGARPVDLQRIAPFLRRLPTVSVLWTPADVLPSEVACAFDVCLTDVAEPAAPWVMGHPDSVGAVVAAQPLAAVALVAHLRSVAALDTWGALAAESALYATLLGGASFRAWRAQRPVSALVAGAAVTTPPVIVRRRGDVLDVELNRPAVHNALNTEMRDALVEALQLAVVDQSVRSIVLSGKGPSFCSGGDLDEFGTVGDGPLAHAVRLTRHPGWWVHECRDRLTVRVHGSCIGAGVELPAFAAVIEAARNAAFSLPELAMGLIPGAGGTVSITRRVGRQRCGWMALTGKAIDAPTAQRWGLVDRLVD